LPPRSGRRRLAGWISTPETLRSAEERAVAAAPGGFDDSVIAEYKKMMKAYLRDFVE